MSIPLLERATESGERVALIDPTGPCSYDELVAAAHGVATAIVGEIGPLAGRRIASLASPGREQVSILWGTWLAGGVAVPLPTSHPVAELERTLDDCEPAMRLATREHLERMAECRSDVPLRSAEELRPAAVELPAVPRAAPALMIYTSGTTGRPKGAVTSHAAIAAQITALVDAWGWTPDDRILHVLPLHHVHGLQVALHTPLWVGACCELAHPFDPERVWERLASGAISVFMAVPTIYARLISAWEAAGASTRARWSAGAGRLRLMTSGSAALPVSLLERWEAATGHRLLERYGMTEIGMALSNPLHGERRPGSVGQPLPEVELRIVGDDGEAVPDGSAGEILVRGPQLFSEYWRRPEETRAAFRDGWFVTGDIAVREAGAVRIVGRRSVDIIKSGGYKVSALEVEEVLRDHASIDAVAVVGVEDADWGECVCAAVVPRSGEVVELSALREWCRERLAPYKLPRRLLQLEALPCNAMGKVTKPALQALFREAADDALAPGTEAS